MPCTKIGALTYHDISSSVAAKYILAAAKEKRFLSVFTPGATVAAAAEKREELRELLMKGDLILPDGVGCRFAARLVGETLCNVSAGIDTATALLALADKEGMRVFLYGGKKGVAEKAARRLLLRYPDVAFAYADGYGEDPTEAILRFSPDLLFVCLGFPKQERFIAARKGFFSFPCLGLGGSLDVFAGKLRRAPLVFRRMGGEWLWRTLREPKRFKRLLPLPRYFLGCARKGGAKFLRKFQKRREKNG